MQYVKRGQCYIIILVNTILKLIIIFISILVLLNLGWWGSNTYKNYLNNKDLGLPAWTKPKPLEKYSIENLSKADIKPVEIKINENIFEFSFDPTLSGKEEKKVTGLINLPTQTEISDKKFPLVVLVRGYVDQSIYQTGVGTKRVGEYLADNNYITLAPDFLGYGGSDNESGNIFESRFQTYTIVLTLLKSIESPAHAKALVEAGWNGKNIFLWGHSNGGQIVLTVLEITGYDYPTVLWAPVTKPFPYSVLYYTDESNDHGKFIRKELAKFEADYDVEKYSLTNYLDRIKAPITIFQGTNDNAVPQAWSDSFVKKLKSLDIKTNYLIYPKADHNMNPIWGDVIIKTLENY